MRALVTEETPVQGRPTGRNAAPPTQAPRFDNVPPPAFPGPGLKSLQHEEVLIMPGRAPKQGAAVAPGDMETFTIPAAPARSAPPALQATTPAPRPLPIAPMQPAPAVLQDSPPHESLPVSEVAATDVPASPTPTVRTTHGRALESHRTLTGEVHQFRRGWRLRYAPIDAEDPYGGSVMLEGVGLDRLRDGQRIRVVGTLIPAEDRLSTTRFQVTTLEIVER
jgi:hypothetical protein